MLSMCESKKGQVYKMPTYTITASFHVDVENDPTLTEEENLESMFSFFYSSVDGHGVHMIKILDVEED